MIQILSLTLVVAVFLLSYFGCVYYEKQSMAKKLKLFNMEQELMNLLLVGSVMLNISFSMRNEHDTFSFVVAATATIAVILGVVKLLWELWFKKE